MKNEGVFEGIREVPKLLFDVVFETWRSAPVIRDVWIKDNEGEYVRDNHLIDRAIADVKKYQEVQLFINELVEQINNVSDFQLVDRSHEDQIWRGAFNQGAATVMSKDAIVKEYVVKYIVE